MNDVPHMTPEEFRQRGYAMIDEVARYMERVGDYPVRSQVKPGDIRAKLPKRAPVEGEDWEAIQRDIESIILPGITHWQSPNFFAYFSANASGPSILGELLSAGLGVQGMLWATSPACTELETHVLDWLVHMLGLPGHFLSTSDGGRRTAGHGVFRDTGSAPHGSRARLRLGQQRQRRGSALRGVRLDPDTLLTGESGDDRGDRSGERPPDRGR